MFTDEYAKVEEELLREAVRDLRFIIRQRDITIDGLRGMLKSECAHSEDLRLENDRLMDELQDLQNV